MFPAPAPPRPADFDPFPALPRTVGKGGFPAPPHRFLAFHFPALPRPVKKIASPSIPDGYIDDQIGQITSALTICRNPPPCESLVF